MKRRTQPVDGPLTGKKFHYWKVGKLLPHPIGKRHSNPKYMCTCKCGIQKAVNAPNLERGASTSCGCRTKTIKWRAKFTPRFVGNFYLESISHYHNPTHVCYNVLCNCGNRVKMLGVNCKIQIGCSRTCPYTLAHMANTRRRTLKRFQAAKKKNKI